MRLRSSVREHKGAGPREHRAQHRNPPDLHRRHRLPRPVPHLRQAARHHLEHHKAAEKCQKILDGAGPTAFAILDQPEPVTDRIVADQVGHHIGHLTGVTEGTRKTYRSVVTHDMTDIGPLHLPMLTRDAVAAWDNRLADRGLSGKSIANRHGLLPAAMNSAVADELIPASPCRGMRLPGEIPAREV